MVATEILLDLLDSQWQNGVVPNLKELIQSTHEKDLDARTELCAADLEWRWRFNRTDGGRTRSTNVGQLPEKMLAADYQHLLGDAWNRPQLRRRMIETEWVARSAWGDQPNVDLFFDPSHMPSVDKEELVDKLNLIAELTISVYRSNDCLFKYPAPSRFIMGRQTTREPPYPAWNANDRRLIIADKHNRSFSREQVCFRRTRVYEAELANVSQNVQIRLNGVVLKLGESMLTPIPISLTLQDIRIVISARAIE